MTSGSPPPVRRQWVQRVGRIAAHLLAGAVAGGAVVGGMVGGASGAVRGVPVPARLSPVALARVTPAAATTASSATLAFTSPTSPGATLTQAPLTLSGEVSRPDGVVNGVDIRVLWTDSAPGRAIVPHPPRSTTVNPPSPHPTFTWTFAPDLGANGRYTVTVAATTAASDGAPPDRSTSSTSFLVDVLPAIPTGVTEAVDATQRVATVSWAKNLEADLVGYQIIRAGPAAGDAGHILDGVGAAATSYTDTEIAVEPPGTYRYQVTAVRPNAAGTGPDVSGPSAEADAVLTTAAKAVAPAPPPAATGGPTKPPIGTGGAGVGPTAVPGNRLVLPTVSGQLPDYNALLGQAQATTVTVPLPDTGFNPQLPYQPQTTQQAIAVPQSDAAPGSTLGAQDLAVSKGGHQAIEFVAGALVLVVLALFALVLKRSAEQVGELDVLVPVGGAPPEGSAGAPPAGAEPASVVAAGAATGLAGAWSVADEPVAAAAVGDGVAVPGEARDNAGRPPRDSPVPSDDHRWSTASVAPATAPAAAAAESQPDDGSATGEWEAWPEDWGSWSEGPAAIEPARPAGPRSVAARTAPAITAWDEDTPRPTSRSSFGPLRTKWAQRASAVAAALAAEPAAATTPADPLGHPAAALTPADRFGATPADPFGPTPAGPTPAGPAVHAVADAPDLLRRGAPAAEPRLAGGDPGWLDAEEAVFADDGDGDAGWGPAIDAFEPLAPALLLVLHAPVSTPTAVSAASPVPAGAASDGDTEANRVPASADRPSLISAGPGDGDELPPAATPPVPRRARPLRSSRRSPDVTPLPG